MQSSRPGRLASLTLRAGVVVVAAGLVAGLPAQAQAQVKWRSGTGAAPQREAKAAFEQKVASLAARRDLKHVVAHFDAPLSAEKKAALRNAGLTLLDYVGSNAYFASVDAAVDAGSLSDDRA